MEIRPILTPDLPAACAFMRTKLAPHLPLDTWIRAFGHGWSASSENHGFMMVEQGRVVGTLGAIYSTRTNNGRPIEWCNFTSWAVDEQFRGKSLLLLSAALKQPGLVFTNFSPHPATLDFFRRLRFQEIMADRWAIANFPRPMRRPIFGKDELAARLRGEALRSFLAHQDLEGVGHLGFEVGSETHYVSYVRGRFRRLRSAVIVHASDWGLLDRVLPDLSTALLWRARSAFTLVDQRRVSRPRFAAVQPWMPVFYRGDGVCPEDVDSLYSEVVTLAPPL